MDFFQSDEYLMMSKHLNPSLSEGKVSFQVSLLFLVFGPLNQTGRLSGLASQPVPQTLGPLEDMKIWTGKCLGRIKAMYPASFLKRHPPTFYLLETVKTYSRPKCCIAGKGFAFIPVKNLGSR